MTDTLAGYIGQEQVKLVLKTALASAWIRQSTVDHILVTGGSGCGKSTIARIIANETGKRAIVANGSSLNTIPALVDILLDLEEGDILFIDEIHRLTKAVETILYNALEAWEIQIPVGVNVITNLTIPLPHFTCIGATNLQAKLCDAIRQRFTVKMQLDYYTKAQLAEIIAREEAPCEVDASGLMEVARRSRSTPRIAKALFRAACAYAVEAGVTLDKEVAGNALWQNGIDEFGLDKNGRRYLEVIMTKAGGGPRGLRSMCNLLNWTEDAVELEEMFLTNIGMVEYTDDGRVATDLAYAHMAQFGITTKRNPNRQPENIELRGQ